MTPGRLARGPRQAFLAAVMVGGLLGAGCGSGGDSDAGSIATTTVGQEGVVGESTTTTVTADPEETAGEEETSGDGCDLFSDEVAAEVLGVEIVRREGHVEGQNVSCIKGLDRTDDPAQFFYVSVGVVAGSVMLVDEFGAQEGSQPVEGLGDRAVYVPNAGVLAIADGDDYIQVQVVKAGAPGSQQDAVTVANDVLDRR